MKRDEAAHKQNAWIGVDLDGTLAEYHGWEGALVIGPPIPKMVEFVKDLLSKGKTVKIFTARIDEPRRWDIYDAINEWCKTHLGVVLGITNVKDKYCETIYDDRAVQVRKNTGELVLYTEEEKLTVEDTSYDRGYDTGFEFGKNEGFEKGWIAAVTEREKYD